MIWHQVSDYALRSDCQRYSVAKTYHGSSANYAAWHLKQVLGDFDNAASAKACCEAHFLSQKNERKEPPTVSAPKKSLSVRSPTLEAA